MITNNLVTIISIVMMLIYVFDYNKCKKEDVPFPLYIYIAMFPYNFGRVAGVRWISNCIDILLIIGFLYFIISWSIARKRIKISLHEIFFLICILVSDLLYIAEHSFTSELLVGLLNFGFVLTIMIYLRNIIDTEKKLSFLVRTFRNNSIIIAVIAFLQIFLEKMYRPMSTFLNSNYYAFYLCISFALVAYFYKHSKWINLYLMFIIVAVFATESITCILCIIIEFFIYIWQYRTTRMFAELVGCIFVVGIISFVILAGEDTLRNLQIVDKILENRDSVRLEVWKVAMDSWKDNKLFGVGYNIFKAKTDISETVFLTHNDFIRVITELGLMGFLVFITYIIKQGYAILKMDVEHIKLYGSLMFTCLIFVLFHNYIAAFIWWWMLSLGSMINSSLE